MYTGRWITIIEARDKRGVKHARRIPCNSREESIRIAERLEKLFPEADVEIEAEILN